MIKNQQKVCENMTHLMNHKKHYITLNNYLREFYDEKVYKIALNPGFTCPNRDGKVDITGCLFCSSSKSGDFSGDVSLSLQAQFQAIKERMQQKWDEGSYIAYLQAGTNTYAPLDVLDATFQTLLNLDDKVKIISIATRPDEINPEVVALIKKIQAKKTVWVELGFQTMHQKSYHFFHRGYENEVFEQAVKLLHDANIDIIVHVINGLPNETKEMMIDTVKYLAKFPLQGIKIHMLHIMKETPLGEMYLEKPFPLLTLEEYVEITAEQLRYLPPPIVIHRLTGDAPINLLIAPKWTIKKFVVLNEIDKYMRKNNIWQGDKAK